MGDHFFEWSPIRLYGDDDLLRGMVFVDHMNFDIALRNLYSDCGQTPKLDYSTLFKGIVGLLPNVDYLKTFIFAPTPDDFLMKDSRLSGYYKWVQGFKSSKYLDVIDGRYISRPVDPAQPMDICDHKSYYKVEKGTDINLAVHALTKAHFNAYDIAFVMSADTDYLTVYQQLKNMGKLVVVVIVKGQNIGKIRPEVDDFLILDKSFFNAHIRKSKPPV